MKKISVMLVIALLLCGLLTACDPSSRLVGTWECDDSDPDYGYPSEITFYDDGTGVVSGDASMNWVADNGILMIDAVVFYIGRLSYEYEFSGSKLVLDGEYSYTKQ